MRIDLNIESRQSACARYQKNECRDQSQLHHLVMHGREAAIGQQPESPHPGKQRRSDAKRNYVCQGIKFAAKVAGGVGHAGNAAVKSVGHHGNANRQRSMIKMPELLRVPCNVWLSA